MKNEYLIFSPAKSDSTFDALAVLCDEVENKPKGFAVYLECAEDDETVGTSISYPFDKESAIEAIRDYASQTRNKSMATGLACGYLEDQIVAGGYHPDDVETLLKEGVIIPAQHALAGAVFETTRYSGITSAGLYPEFVSLLNDVEAKKATDLARDPDGPMNFEEWLAARYADLHHDDVDPLCP